MKKNLKNTLLAVVLLLSVNIFAQDEDPDNPGGDPGQEPAAPIKDYLPLLLLSAIVLGYKTVAETENPIKSIK